MYNPLLLSSIPSLLNASLTTVPNTVSTPGPPEPKGSTVAYCWPQSAAQEGRLTPTTFIACRDVIKQIPITDAGLKPITFSRSPTAGFRVPHTFEAPRSSKPATTSNNNNCAVEIDVTDPHAEETLSFAELVIAAFDVTVGCVIPGPHLGGRAQVGGKEGLKIWVYGFREEPVGVEEAR
ncbi:hypothetical protein ACLMJK_007522 [Lecanora helva]